MAPSWSVFLAKNVQVQRGRPRWRQSIVADERHMVVDIPIVMILQQNSWINTWQMTSVVFLRTDGTLNYVLLELMAIHRLARYGA